MNRPVSSRVRIGTCEGLADAALVRSVFTAHGIHVVVGSENHASVLTGLGGGFASLDICVDEADAEDAAELLHDLRERSASSSASCDGDDEPDGDDDDFLEDVCGTGAAYRGRGDDDDDDAEDADDPDSDLRGRRTASPTTVSLVAAPGESLRIRVDRRRRTAVVLLLACCITFGTAHMFTRAWMRGLLLAAFEAFGLRCVVLGDPIGGVIVATAVLFDLFGALWRVRTAPATRLPIARLR
jgi:hypothetical protein